MQIVAMASIVVALSSAAVPAAQTRLRIAEVEARRVSDAQYRLLVDSARSRGWTYDSAQIASGYRRHYEEFRLRLLNRGIEVVPTLASP